MPSYALGLSYDGSSLHGWQSQTDVPTVQGAVEQAISQVAAHPIRVRVAGRTDAGVHATGQVAAFHSDAQRSLHDWQRGLNALTPDDIRIDWVVPVAAAFHPRYSATARRYIYVYHDCGYRHPLLGRRVWGCEALDADAMHRAAQQLVGEHDFSSFRAAGCQSLTPMRRVNRATVRRQGAFVTLEIEANAFLLHMVRNIAAGLFAVGARSQDLDLGRLLAARDRSQLGPTAPPDGLYLVHVSYPEFSLPSPGAIPFLPLR